MSVQELSHVLATPSAARPRPSAGQRPCVSDARSELGVGEATPLCCSWWFLLGVQAHGLGQRDNPYLAGSAAHAEWALGWLDADRAARFELEQEDARVGAYFDRL
jgi:hypothetical protein